MAAVMMQAHGTETMIVKDGNKYSADFRYKNVDYEQDEYNGRCYFLDTSRSFFNSQGVYGYKENGRA